MLENKIPQQKKGYSKVIKVHIYETYIIISNESHYCYRKNIPDKPNSYTE